MDLERRTLIGAGALLLTGAAGCATADTPAEEAPLPTAVAPGAPGDFDWLTGEWRIAHRQKRQNGEWISFNGEATCRSVMGGVGHVEDLRIPERNFNGMGLRLLDLETHVWSDYWVNAQSGVLGAAGLTGGFQNGVGMFTADDTESPTPMKYAGVWDLITPTSHRWRQGMSTDGGRTWEFSWIMDWRRVG